VDWTQTESLRRGWWKNAGRRIRGENGCDKATMIPAINRTSNSLTPAKTATALARQNGRRAMANLASTFLGGNGGRRKKISKSNAQ